MKGLLSPKVMIVLKNGDDEEYSDCPVATQDIEVNLKNRQKAIDKAQYGPMNPNEPNSQYWRDMGQSEYSSSSPFCFTTIITLGESKPFISFP